MKYLRYYRYFIILFSGEIFILMIVYYSIWVNISAEIFPGSVDPITGQVLVIYNSIP